MREGSPQPLGYSIDLCLGIVDEVVRELNGNPTRVDYRPVTPDTRLDAVVSGKVDLECGSTTSNLERQKKVAFSPIIYVAGTKIMVKRGSGIASYRDLSGKTLVVTSGTTNEAAMKLLNDKYKLGIAIVSARDHEESYDLLAQGKADAFATDDILLNGFILAKKAETTMQVVGDFITYEPYGIMFRKDDPLMADAVRRAFETMARTRGLVNIYRKWFLEPTPTGEPSICPSQCSSPRRFTRSARRISRPKREWDYAVAGASISHRRSRRTAVVIGAVEKARQHLPRTGRIIAGRSRARDRRGGGPDLDQLGRSPGRLLDELIAPVVQKPERVGRKRGGLILDLVRQPLMMDARRIDRFLRFHAVIDDVHHDFGHRGDDARAARATEHQEDLAVLGDERGRHRGERPLPGLDRVRRALHQPEKIGHAWFHGEVIHLVVEEEPRARRDHIRAEQAVDGEGHGDGVAVLVDDRIMRGLGLLMGFDAGLHRA